MHYTGHAWYGIVPESLEGLFIDGTHKVNGENYAIYVLIVEDGNRLAQAVGRDG